MPLWQMEQLQFRLKHFTRIRTLDRNEMIGEDELITKLKVTLEFLSPR